MLQIFGPNVEYIHDWDYMLRAMGLFRWTFQIAFLVKMMSLAAVLFFLASGTWMLARMAFPVRED